MSLRFWLSFQVRCVVVLSPASFCLRRLFYPRPTRTAIINCELTLDLYKLCVCIVGHSRHLYVVAADELILLGCVNSGLSKTSTI